MTPKAALLAEIATSAMLVNHKWCPILKQRPDLRRLLKQGLVCQVRAGGGRRHWQNRSSAKRCTMLRITPMGLQWLARNKISLAVQESNA